MVPSSLPGASTLPVNHTGEGLFLILWRRRIVVLLALIAAVAAGVLYLSQVTNYYASTARLYVEQTGPKVISEQEGIMTQSKNYLYTQAELLKSLPVLSRVIEDPSRENLKTFAYTENRIQHLKDYLDVSVGKQDDIINVAFLSPYPDESAQIVNALVDSYITYHATSKRTTAGEVLKILHGEKGKCDRELSEKFQKLVAFTRTNGTISLESDTNNIVMNRLNQLSQALTQAQLEVMQTKADYEALERFANDPVRLSRFLMTLPSASKGLALDTHPDRLREELDRLEKQLKILQQQSTPHHPAVQALMLRLARLKRRMAEQENNQMQAYRAALIQRWVTAMQKEADIQATFDRQQEKALEYNARAAEYTVLQSDLKRAERLCDILDARIREMNVNEDTGALNISILEVARPAREPTSPDKPRVMSLVALVGLLLGIGLALLCEWMDQRIRNTREISALLGVPVLGAVPLMNPKDSVLMRGQKVLLAPTSSTAETFRTIRTSIYFGCPKDQARTILITSPTQGDGKTTVLSNLAVTMAQSGQRTLIIDGDLRKPMQHVIFCMDKSPADSSVNVPRLVGLADVISGRASLEQAIRQTHIDGLDIMVGASVNDNPSELLNSAAFMEMIRELREQYDRILIDSPPALQVADARILGGLCDLSILVLRAEKSTRHLTERTRDVLLSVGAHLLGVVVNGQPRKHNPYLVYGGYGYHRSPGPPSDRKKKCSPPPGVIPADSVKSAIDEASQMDRVRQIRKNNPLNNAPGTNVKPPPGSGNNKSTDV